jgi:general secretion pathway protein G
LKGGEKVKNRIKKIAQLILAGGSRKEEGVTLIELLAVIVILAIIAAVAVPVVLSSIHRAKINSTVQTEATIASAMNRYAADHDGDFPTASTDLTSAGVDGDGPYLQQAIPEDAWGHDFVITYATTGSDHFEIITGNGTTDVIRMEDTYQAPEVNPTT